MTQVPELSAALDGTPLGPYSLRLADVQPGSKSGWTSFRLLLAVGKHTFVPPVIEAVFSRGGRGAFPWLEITEYHSNVTAARDRSIEANLAAAGLDRFLFRHLSGLLPPGGHIMLACEAPQHETSYRLLMRRVPPVLTTLGTLLFDSGFRSVRFFYLAEGGWEGQQKLWAEKPINEVTARRWDEQTARDILRFLAEPAHASFGEVCVTPALMVLGAIQPGKLKPQVEAVLRECAGSGRQRPQAFFSCVQRLRQRFADQWP